MSQIISIHSYRGGTGKSNIVANLATLVAAGGKRVAIVDTDIQSPGIHVIFSLDDEQIRYTLNDFLWGNCQISETAYDVTPTSVLTQQGQIFLIPSSCKANAIAKVLREGYDVGILNDGFNDLIEQLGLDFLFIDTHPGLNEETLLSIAVSNALIIILRPDNQDFQGTAVTLDVARKLGVPHIFMLINKVIPSMDARVVREKVTATFQVAVPGVFQLTEEMMQLASSDIFALRYPDHIFTEELRQVSRLLSVMA